MFKTLTVAALVLAPATAFAQPTAAPARPHAGLTFEANLGFGFLRISGDGDSQSEGSIAGLDLGIGGFLNPRMALTLRIAGVTYVADGGQITQAFLGPSLQYWATPNVWLGGGIGLGVVQIKSDFGGSDSETKLGLDLRAGYTFNPNAKHSFNLSVEFTPTFFDGGTISGLGLLLGYQLL